MARSLHSHGGEAEGKEITICPKKMCNYSCAAAMKARCGHSGSSGDENGLPGGSDGWAEIWRTRGTDQAGECAERGAQVFLAPVPTASFQQELALPLNALSFTWWVDDVGNSMSFPTQCHHPMSSHLRTSNSIRGHVKSSPPLRTQCRTALPLLSK